MTRRILVPSSGIEPEPPLQWKHGFFFFFFGFAGYLRCCLGLSLVPVSGGYSLVAELGLLIAVASLVAEHRL